MSQVRLLGHRLSRNVLTKTKVWKNSFQSKFLQGMATKIYRHTFNINLTEIIPQFMRKNSMNSRYIFSHCSDVIKNRTHDFLGCKSVHIIPCLLTPPYKVKATSVSTATKFLYNKTKQNISCEVITSMIYLNKYICSSWKTSTWHTYFMVCWFLVLCWNLVPHLVLVVKTWKPVLSLMLIKYLYFANHLLNNL